MVGAFLKVSPININGDQVQLFPIYIPLAFCYSMTIAWISHCSPDASAFESELVDPLRCLYFLLYIFTGE